MRRQMIRAGGLNTLRLLQVLAAVTGVFLVILASAPVRPYFAEWRRVQQRYNRAAVAAGLAPTVIEVKQIWKPALGVTDRCVTCHLGMGSANPISGDRLFGAHPPIPHDPREFGCTVCHGGQGRATIRDDAHGFVSHWDEQMLDRQHIGAGCGSCHDRFPTAPMRVLAAGGRLIERLDCLSCHRLDGRGRGAGPDLTYVGLKGFDAAWSEKHRQKHEAAIAEPGPAGDAGRAADAEAWRSSYGPIAAADLQTLDQFLKTRVGAPRVVEARALAAGRGCLGCHKLSGAGGDEGPALDAVGRRAIGDLNFARVTGPQTFTNYLRQHFLDPSGVFPGSTMVTQNYSDAELDLLVEWVLSLRARTLPATYLPKDRVRRQVLGEPRERQSPEDLFGAYCSACHGPAGEGRTVGNSEGRFPAIGSADFLAIASDDFIVRTLTTGRPGRRMPPLAAAAGPLDDVDARAVAAWLRSRQSTPPAFAEVKRLTGDAALGAALYEDRCAACHGRDGRGTPLGSPLSRRSTEEAGYEVLVAGVRGTAMPAYATLQAEELAALLRYMATLPSATAPAAAWRVGAGDPERGSAIYARVCSGCHGPAGEGKLGPALANPAFRQAASTEYVAATVMLGRRGTPMPSFASDSVSYSRLTAADALDVAAYVRGALGTAGSQGDR